MVATVKKKKSLLDDFTQAFQWATIRTQPPATNTKYLILRVQF